MKIMLLDNCYQALELLANKIAAGKKGLLKTEEHNALQSRLEPNWSSVTIMAGVGQWCYN